MVKCSISWLRVPGQIIKLVAAASLLSTQPSGVRVTTCWLVMITLSDISSKHFPVLSLFVTYHRFVTRLTRQVSLVEQELLTLPEHLSSLPVFRGVRVTWSLVLYVCIVDRCLSLCTFSFGHCVVCSSSIYRFWLPLWYLQTLLSARLYKTFQLSVLLPYKTDMIIISSKLTCSIHGISENKHSFFSI